MLLVGQDSVYEREPGHEGKERKRGHWGGDAFKRLSIAHHRLPFPGKASQPPIAVCGSSGPDILSGWMERRRGGQSLLLQSVHRNISSLLFSSHPIPPTFASFRSDFPFKYLFLPPLFVRALVVVPVV